MRLLDDWITRYLELNDNSEPPICYHLWTAIVTIAACMQRKCYLDWGMTAIYPNFYAILVGPPGGRKGTAMFTDFWVTGWVSDPLLWAQHDPWLVLLSVLVAVGASAVGLYMAGLAQMADDPRDRRMALGSGTLALGVSIWTMHYIGMVAIAACGRGRFDVWITAASLLPSLGAAWVALRLLSHARVGAGRLVGGALLVGGGIGAMHYMGMAASDIATFMHYDVGGFVLSLVVAVLLAWLALWVRFGLQQRWTMGLGWLNAVSAL